MFSQLGPLFKTTLLREAERADTRLEIRRHEQDQQGRKNEDNKADDEGSFLWDDSTQVSVEALKNFLVEFLKDKTQGQGIGNSATSRTEQTPAATRTPVNPVAERAMKAYGVSASHAPSSAPEESPAIEIFAEQSAEPQDGIESEDIRNMHMLIADLDMLSRQGVQMLTIEKADSFLEALIMAVRTAKAAI